MRVFRLVLDIIGAIALVFVMECVVAICGLDASAFALWRFVLYAVLGIRIGLRFKSNKVKKVKSRKQRA